MKPHHKDIPRRPSHTNELDLIIDSGLGQLVYVIALHLGSLLHLCLISDGLDDFKPSYELDQVMWHGLLRFTYPRQLLAEICEQASNRYLVL